MILCVFYVSRQTQRVADLAQGAGLLVPPWARSLELLLGEVAFVSVADASGSSLLENAIRDVVEGFLAAKNSQFFYQRKLIDPSKVL